MISAASFCDKARNVGFALYTGVPCSYLTPFINYVIAASASAETGLRYVGASDEACAVAIAAGAELGGRRSVVMLQNSGLGNAVNPLTSLCAIFELPVLLVVTLRGDDNGHPDEPQHALMGKITTQLLTLMDVPWEPFPVDEAAIVPSLARAVTHMDRARTPYAFVLRKGDVGPGAPAPRERETLEASHSQTLPSLGPPTWPTLRPSRTELLAAVQKAVGPHDVVLATTGHTGRELLALGDRPNQLYVVGSMGCASSLALGLAWTIPSRRVIVVDGDGAALMHLGAMATLGRERPPNLVHVLLDNEMHESTGGQATVSESVDLAVVARACQYPRVFRVTSAHELVAVLAEPARELTFVHAKIRASVPAALPRPTLHPRDVASRLRKFVGGERR